MAGDSGTKEKYLELIRLKNETAVKQGFKNLADGWQYDYNTDNFGDVVMKVWKEKHQISQGEQISLEDLYKQLHAYIRRRLIKIYNQQVRNPQNKELKFKKIFHFGWSYFRGPILKRMAKSQPICWEMSGVRNGITYLNSHNLTRKQVPSM